MPAIAQVDVIDFPVVPQGEIIAGSVTLRNVGDETTSEEAGFLGVLVKTLWDGQEYTLFAASTTAPGGTFTFDFHAFAGGIGIMPAGATEIEVTGRVWLALQGQFRVDDIVNFMIGEPPVQPPATFNMILPFILGGLILVAVLDL